jgi:hypothetical protein
MGCSQAREVSVYSEGQSNSAETITDNDRRLKSLLITILQGNLSIDKMKALQPLTTTCALTIYISSSVTDSKLER